MRRPPAAKAPRAPRAPKSRADLSPVDEIRLAFKPKNRLAATVGAAFGGSIPALTCYTAHTRHADRALYAQAGTYFAACGVVFSLLTVYQWGTRIFGHRLKAVAFAVLLEGAMVTSESPWAAGAVLGLLVAVNAVALACNLVLPPQRKEA